MSDVNLLVFGCAVSMIAAAGVYVYIRERFTVDRRVAKPVVAAPRRARKAAERRLRKVA